MLVKDLNNAFRESESNLEDDVLPPLVRNRSTHMASASVNPHQESDGTDSSHTLSNTDHAGGDQPPINENALQSDEVLCFRCRIQYNLVWTFRTNRKNICIFMEI